MSNTIQLGREFIHEENTGDGVIKPGMLVEKTSADKVQAHSTEGGYAEKAFAVEDALQGKTVADSYADETIVSYHIQPNGGMVNALIKAGENVAIGDKLISAGDGTLIKESSAGSGVVVKQIVAVALEANDLSASGAVDTLSAVRIL